MSHFRMIHFVYSSVFRLTLPIYISLCAYAAGLILIFKNIWNDTNVSLEHTLLQCLRSKIDII